MTLILSGTDNSATTPAVTGTDTDTGIYYPATNQVAIATNGTQAMLVNASQNVGIGTSSPANRLQVSKAGAEVARFTNTQSNGADYEFKLGGGGFEDRKFMLTDKFSGADNVRTFVDSSGNFAFNSGYGSAAIAYGCRAWVNFNGTGTVAIRASGNVSSITDNGTGNYVMNFATAMPDTDYCCTMNGRTGGGVQSIITLNRDSSPSTTTNPIYVVNPSTPGVLQDEAFVMVAVFR